MVAGRHADTGSSAQRRVRLSQRIASSMRCWLAKSRLAWSLTTFAGIMGASIQVTWNRLRTKKTATVELTRA